MRIAIAFAIVCLGASIAAAQPGQPQPVQPQPPPPQPYPQPQPQPYPQPYPQQQPYYPQQPYPVALSEDDRRILAIGEITEGQQFIGGVANFFVGFGVGQAIQGRWTDTGWIFTLGEGASLAVAMVGLVQLIECDVEFDGCNDDGPAGTLLVGLVGYTVFHVWSIIDAVAAPPGHNRRLREIRTRMGYQPQYYGRRFVPYLTPPRDGNGVVGGLALRF